MGVARGRGRSNLEALGLLFELEGVFLSQLPLCTLHVLLLGGELGTVLSLHLVLPQRVHCPLLAVLELLGALVVSQQHGVGRLQLLLTLAKLLTKQ